MRSSESAGGFGELHIELLKHINWEAAMCNSSYVAACTRAWVCLCQCGVCVCVHVRHVRAVVAKIQEQADLPRSGFLKVEMHRAR